MNWKKIDLVHRVEVDIDELLLRCLDIKFQLHGLQRIGKKVKSFQISYHNDLIEREVSDPVRVKAFELYELLKEK